MHFEHQVQKDLSMGCTSSLNSGSLVAHTMCNLVAQGWQGFLWLHCMRHVMNTSPWTCSKISAVATISIVLSRQRTIKMLIRMHGCADWPASLLDEYDLNRFSHDLSFWLNACILHDTVHYQELILTCYLITNDAICNCIWESYVRLALVPNVIILK